MTPSVIHDLIHDLILSDPSFVDEGCVGAVKTLNIFT